MEDSGGCVRGESVDAEADMLTAMVVVELVVPSQQ